MSYDKETLVSVAMNDVEETWRKDTEYGQSWKKRGGVGAFMMLARKWDRIEEQVKRDRDVYITHDAGASLVAPYDLLNHILADKRPEGLIDDIRDLRRYLILVEAELVAQGAFAPYPVAPRWFPLPPLGAGEPSVTERVLAEAAETVERGTGQKHPFGFDRTEEML